jgi:hypothetical protein
MPLPVQKFIAGCLGALLVLLIGSLPISATEPPTIVDPPGELERLARLFPSGSRLLRQGSHLILYDTSDLWADNRLTMLQRTHDAFYQRMRADGWAITPIARRLVCLLFADYEDYRRYAQQAEGAAIDGTGGYYSLATNRIAIYNNDSNPQLLQQRAQIDELQRTIARLDLAIGEAGRRGDADAVHRYRQQRARLTTQLSTSANHQQAVAGLHNIATTIHEATHQLCYNSGLLSRFVRHPLWLSEGIATAFETTHPALAFGPGHDNPTRRRNLLAATRRGSLIPLSTLVNLTEIPGQTLDEKSDFYAQSWGLFTMLYQSHLPQLQRYVALLNQRTDPQVAFTQAFGDPATFEGPWRRFIGGLRP